MKRMFALLLAAVLLLCLRLPKSRAEVFLGEEPELDKGGLILYMVLLTEIIPRFSGFQAVYPQRGLQVILLERFRIQTKRWVIILQNNTSF